MLPRSPVQAGTQLEIVARRIAGMIQASYRIGQRLPAERDLAKTFGVSRPTVREAILVAGDGPVVLKVAVTARVYAISRRKHLTCTRSKASGRSRTWRRRQLIEPQIAAIAAQRGSEASLRAACRATCHDALGNMRRHVRPTRLDHRFHVVLAEATGNGTLGV